MERKASTGRSDLEYVLSDKSAEPKALPLSLLEDITNGFSDNHEIGRDGFAVVYKGLLRNGTVAVKKLSKTHMYEKEFHREVECLMNVKHKNVVRFLGYCADTQGNMAWYNGKYVMADVQQRLLCFEYLRKGSLHDYMTDASREPKFRDCYGIIKGICEGLHYLHHNRIVHLDLKPANILLDNSMVPKIADFGLSRCFDEKQSWAITSKLIGSVGYFAPEFYSGKITFKSDIYSLGVIIIEILTGEKGYPDDQDVLETWKDRLEKSHRDTQLEQLRVCIEVGKECTDYNPARRPDTQRIIDRLEEMERTVGCIETGDSCSSVKHLCSGVGESSSSPGGAAPAPHENGRRVGNHDICSELLERLVADGHVEASLPEFRAHFKAHLARLPYSYQLSLHLDKAEDVLIHQRVLEQAKDPDKRPVYHVRYLRKIDEDTITEEDDAGNSPSTSLINDSLQGESRARSCKHLMKYVFRPWISYRYIHEIVLCSVDKPKILSQMSALLSDIGVGIIEASIYSTIDSYSLGIFLVDGWPLEFFSAPLKCDNVAWYDQDTDGLDQALGAAVSRKKGL